MTTQSLTLTRIRALQTASRIPVPAALLVAAALMIVEWNHRHRTRTRLSELDARMLQDVGLTEAQAAQEANKRFWQR